MKVSKLIKLVATLLVMLTTIAIFDTNTYKVHEVQLRTAKLKPTNRIKLLQISDLHNRDLSGKFEQILQLTPDLIVLTGDLIDKKTKNLSTIKIFLDHLSEMDKPIYYVSGNHEVNHQLYSELTVLLEEANVQILDNSSQVIEHNEGKFALAGVANASTGHANIDKALTEIDESMLTILLSHTPLTEAEPVDLIVSGHTHGGQVRLPFIGGLIAPDQGLFPKYDKGLYSLDHQTSLYIDSGIGTSVLPIRLFNRAQVSVITIEGVEVN
ncbi:hypothetical protein SAMN04488134_101646 [Amphibacillus marinus]|uniref:Calcineurin-like phosphoesterase domain-containing protein n=1 Tax=Amphibacillus marinus TaxID=872970 RepID=A0A1H8IKN0_9BACI|nr:metallophosphoesterase [Amphibacillus marinus]SEN69044.1 hypothetical protein SAMN04488134_101646 [Amphibacillus marinus]